jgi:hypothetical protein
MPKTIQSIKSINFEFHFLDPTHPILYPNKILSWPPKVSLIKKDLSVIYQSNLYYCMQIQSSFLMLNIYILIMKSLSMLVQN